MGWPWGHVTDGQGRACRTWCPRNKAEKKDGHLAQGHSGQHKLTEVKEGMAARLCKGIFTAKVSQSPQCPP